MDVLARDFATAFRASRDEAEKQWHIEALVFEVLHSAFPGVNPGAVLHHTRCSPADGIVEWVDCVLSNFEKEQGTVSSEATLL